MKTSPPGPAERYSDLLSTPGCGQGDRLQTRHSLERIRERGFSRESIRAIVNRETDVIVYPSTRDPGIDLYFGKDEGKHLPVVCNRESGTVVTVRNMRRKEKALFNEVMRNEKKER